MQTLICTRLLQDGNAAWEGICQAFYWPKETSFNPLTEGRIGVISALFSNVLVGTFRMTFHQRFITSTFQQESTSGVPKPSAKSDSEKQETLWKTLIADISFDFQTPAPSLTMIRFKRFSISFRDVSLREMGTSRRVVTVTASKECFKNCSLRLNHSPCGPNPLLCPDQRRNTRAWRRPRQNLGTRCAFCYSAMLHSFVEKRNLKDLNL
jgi:hypothetical protein